jgi:hypothetical protein
VVQTRTRNIVDKFGFDDYSNVFSCKLSTGGGVRDTHMHTEKKHREIQGFKKHDDFLLGQVVNDAQMRDRELASHTQRQGIRKISKE